MILLNLILLIDAQQVAMKPNVDITMEWSSMSMENANVVLMVLLDIANTGDLMKLKSTIIESSLYGEKI